MCVVISEGAFGYEARDRFFDTRELGVQIGEWIPIGEGESCLGEGANGGVVAQVVPAEKLKGDLRPSVANIPVLWRIVSNATRCEARELRKVNSGDK